MWDLFSLALRRRDVFPYRELLHEGGHELLLAQESTLRAILSHIVVYDITDGRSPKYRMEEQFAQLLVK